MPIFRQSKVKHVFGKPLKRNECYDGIRITKMSWDSTFCSVNPKYVAVITEAAGGGAFLVLPLDKVGRVDTEAPLVAGHKAAVLDIQWCPHDDDIIASASEDCTVKVWQIPEGGIPPKEKLTECVSDLIGHQRRVGLVVWHPTAENVLLSAGADNAVFIWDVSKAEALVEFSLPDMLLSASFNYNGSKLATTCKDKMVRIINPRTGEVTEENQCHAGAKPQQVIYLDQNRIVTTGFSRMSERQFALWNDNDLTNPLFVEDLDTTNGTLFPFYDRDLNLLYLCGKGDSVIRYFEITTESPYFYPIEMYKSPDPQRGFGWMPKRGCDVNTNEVARFFKLHTKGLCEVIPFIAPRKSELYQDDLYPDAVSDQAALTADEWMSGIDKDPLLFSMKDNFNKTTVSASKLPKKGATAWTKSKTANKDATAANETKASHSTNSQSTPSVNGTSQQKQVSHQNGDQHSAIDPKLIEELTNNLGALQKTVSRFDSTISTMTERINQLESHVETLQLQLNAKNNNNQKEESD